MSNFRTLDVYHAATAQLRALADITGDIRFGDLSSQLRRAGISVVSNIAEGAGRGRGSDADFARFLCIARASNDEIAAQLDIVAALSGNPLHEVQAANVSLGRQLSGLIRYLRRSAG